MNNIVNEFNFVLCDPIMCITLCPSLFAGDINHTSGLCRGIIVVLFAIAVFGLLSYQSISPHDSKFTALNKFILPSLQHVNTSECLNISLTDPNAITLERLDLLYYLNSNKEKKELRIVQNIASHWEQLGRRLIGYQLVENIAKNHDKGLDYIEKCCWNVLKRWLEQTEGPYPVSWEGLINGLKDSQLLRQANKLKQALKCILS